MSVENTAKFATLTQQDRPRVVVCGAFGMLGASLVPHLAAAGYDVAGVSRRAGSRSADLTNADEARTALDALAPDVIINLAALTNVDECERNPQLAYLMNVRIVENVASWMLRSGGRSRLVHVSTDQVYDGPGPHAEHATTLVNYYAFSKYAGELAAKLVEATVLRTNFFGPSQCAERQSLSDWITASLTAGKPITVFEDVMFSPLSLGTLVQTIERTVRDPRPGVFNLGSRDGMSKADFAFEVARALALPTTTVTRGTSDSAKFGAYRPKDMRMDSQRFEREYDCTLPSLRDEIHLLKGAPCH
jgi:dTDP-4-dehydrorhamnose reductase